VSKDSIGLVEATAARGKLSAPIVTATATVTNTGTRAATEVVQCYVRNLGASVEQPVRSLEGFERVTLAPGESKQVSFPLGFDELSFFNQQSIPTIEATHYTVWIGGSSLADQGADFIVAGPKQASTAH
jgi:beta-glucosidase